LPAYRVPESLFSGLFCVKGNLTSQNRRLGVPKLGVSQLAFCVDQPLSGVSDFHISTLVYDLAATIRLPINKADLFPKRFKPAIGHNQNVHWHIDVIHGLS
jgi:hypothetical protein